MGGDAGIGSMYGVMKEDSGYYNRAMVLIDKEVVVVSRIMSNLPIGSEKEESNEEVKQEGFLRCQTPTSTVRLKVEGCRVKNGGCRIESEEWRLKDYK